MLLNGAHEIYSVGPIYSNSALVYIVAWHRAGTMALLNRQVRDTQNTDAMSLKRNRYSAFQLDTLTDNLNSSALDKMDAVSQTIFSNAFSGFKSFVFWLKFH